MKSQWLMFYCPCLSCHHLDPYLVNILLWEFVLPAAFFAFCSKKCLVNTTVTQDSLVCNRNDYYDNNNESEELLNSALCSVRGFHHCLYLCVWFRQATKLIPHQDHTGNESRAKTWPRWSKLSPLCSKGSIIELNWQEKEYRLIMLLGVL